ncbi:hypothetical protein B0H17DRAFT_1059733 [Mycena rosella]|uniref:NmrA-like domain-containing protein n=1 Tax=Mycena rosella TaxID=1033263 RepID=A0AAD7DKE3_MYCRO|nr:hypothetical protein B0H17DRAFT_1059733 [Mycena rosella]
MYDLKKIVVVIGATGTQGGYVVQELLKHPEYHVRAVTRDPRKPSAKALASSVELVQANLNDLPSLKMAFAGAHAIFAYTDFFDTPLTTNEVFKESETLEFNQGMNLALAAAATSSLEHYIWSSTPDATEQSAGKHPNICFFNSKSRVTCAIRTKMPALWAKTTEIWIGFMYENFIKFATFSPQPTPSGVYELAVPLAPDSVLGSVHCKDLGPFFDFILRSGTRYHAKTIGLVAEELPESRRLEIWGHAVDKPVRFNAITPAEYVARLEGFGVPTAAAEGFTDLYGLFKDLGNAYSGEDVLQARDLVPGGFFRSWKDYCHEEDWAAFLKA